MKVIPWEDSLTTEQQALIVGSLLGDARLECRSQSGTARLRIHHADRQSDLVFWKYNLLKPFVLRAPWKTVWKDKRNGKEYISWFFHTQTSFVFARWHKLFYPKRQKELPESIGRYLNPMAMAVWFMDDGCFQSGSIILNTQSFTLLEQEFLQNIFLEKFRIMARIQKDRKNYRLYFGKEEKKQMERIIRPFLLPSFYKTIPVTTDPDVKSGEIAAAR